MRCTRKGCCDDASCYPEVLVWPLGYDTRTTDPARARIEMPLCRTHGRAVVEDPGLIVSDAGWEQIRAIICSMGKVSPDRKSMRVELVPLSAGAVFVQKAAGWSTRARCQLT